MPPVIVKGIPMHVGVDYGNDEIKYKILIVREAFSYRTGYYCMINYLQGLTDAEILADLERQVQSLPRCSSDPGVHILITRDLTCAHCCQPLFGEKYTEGFNTLHRCSIEHTLITTEDGELLFQSGD